jgi:hypothetical protein
MMEVHKHPHHAIRKINGVNICWALSLKIERSGGKNRALIKPVGNRILSKALAGYNLTDAQQCVCKIVAGQNKHSTLNRYFAFVVNLIGRFSNATTT